MRAIVVEIKNGPTEFFLYDNDVIFSHFRKLCRLQGVEFIDRIEDFEDLLEIYVPLGTNKIFQGPGVYDYEGNKHSTLTDEGGTVYYIIENYSQTTYKIKLISNLKIISPPVLN